MDNPIDQYEQLQVPRGLISSSKPYGVPLDDRIKSNAASEGERAPASATLSVAHNEAVQVWQLAFQIKVQSYLSE